MTSRTAPDRLGGLTAAATAAYRRQFQGEPAFVVAAPGRVNLIGEHTDYNDGFVLPAAIDRHVVVAASPRNDSGVHVYAADLGESASFDLGDVQQSAEHPWNNYQRAVAWALQGAGYRLGGLDMVVTSNVPIAAGLSSSAAIELAAAHAFEVAGGWTIGGVERALLCQKAENEFVGMRCGIMDQYIISLGEAGHALLIDCRSLEYRAIPMAAGPLLVICDTKKRRGLVDSEYNLRRQECERGAALLGVRALRDVTPAELGRRQGELEPTTLKRCRHVVTENQRVLDAVQALEADDLAAFGRLMNASHESLRDDYEVTGAELDALAEAAWGVEGVLGARMTGAGFGGCTVNLVAPEALDEFLRRVPDEYRQRTGLEAEIHVCHAVQGVHRVR
ncbi:MAG: galactokinase [Chloroflexi bacterium]|jgi:galactokinase|nr:galactokinase [Chloroflexota bacterium]